ncbi:MAG: hypothetical protein AAGJ79_04105 [Verrucomicrobiota bacterium]
MRLFGLASISLLCVLTQPALAGAFTGPKVLYLGDSMSMGAFGETFDREMRDAGCDVFTHVAGGATPYYWLSRYSPIASSIGYWEKTPSTESRQKYIRAVPKVEKLVEQYRPDVVVVQTGTNLYATLRSKRRTKEANILEVETLLQNMAKAATMYGADIYWVTPPQSHPRRYPYELQEEMATIMKRAVSRYGRVFDSRRVTEFTDPYPKTDGIHYGPTEAREWARVVGADFQRYLEDRDHLRPSRQRPLLLASNDDSSKKKGGILKRLLVKSSTANGVVSGSEPAVAMAASAPSVTPSASNKPLPIPKTEPKAAPVTKASPVVVAENPTPEPEMVPVPTKPDMVAKVESTPPPVPKEPVIVESEPPARRPSAEPKVIVTTAEPVGSEWGTIVATLRLKAKSHIPHINNVTYDHCFALFEYEVVELHSGDYPFGTIRIAETACFNRRRMPALDYEIGKVRALKLDPLDDYPNLKVWQMNDDLSVRPELPVYIPSLR